MLIFTVANFQNFRNIHRPNCLDGLGQKVKTVFEFGKAAKGLYDAGKIAYEGFQVAAPFIEAAMRAGL